LFCSTRAWTHGLHLEPLHQPFFVIFFKIGSFELLVQADFELRSSWVARITGASHLCLAGSWVFAWGWPQTAVLLPVPLW
jgi:hypothetical protein